MISFGTQVVLILIDFLLSLVFDFWKRTINLEVESRDRRRGGLGGLNALSRGIPGYLDGPFR